MLQLEKWKKQKKALKLTFDDLSKVTQISRRQLQYLFKGEIDNPRIETVQAIERALGLAPTFTDEERALGAGQEKTVLSQEEWEWLEQMEELKQKKGATAVKVIQDMIRAYIDN